jgi:Ni/Fe-hydrogenase 1 B-type cytochrome subunit
MTAALVVETDVPVKVWDHLVRITHWLIALSIVTLAATGYYIGSPFVIAAGPAGQHFVMGTVKVVHFYAAIVFTLSVLTRIAWLFLGKGHARWRELIPVDKARRVGLWRAMAFYGFLRKRPEVCVGHNPLAGLAYTGVFALYLVMIATGIGLYGADASVTSPLHFSSGLLAVFGGAQGARWIHHVVMWVLLLFVIQHVYSAMLTAVTERNGTMDSIFSGTKWVSPKVAAEDRGERVPR